MKIAYASDLHLEFAPINDEFFAVDADVLILAGDVAPEKELKKHMDFWKRVSEKWDQVIYVFGNHEYYGASIPKSFDRLRFFFFDEFPNIHVMDHTQSLTISSKNGLDNGVCFVGDTVWTSYGDGNPIAMNVARETMNDHKLIKMSKNGYRKFLPADAHKMHREQLEGIFRWVSVEKNPVVVISHHAPTSLSVPARFRDSRFHMENLAYYSDLSDLILDTPNIVHWVHGHTHDFMEYEVGQCIVHCNPRGYPGERPNRLVPFQPKVFEVEGGSKNHD